MKRIIKGKCLKPKWQPVKGNQRLNNLTNNFCWAKALLISALQPLGFIPLRNYPVRVFTLLFI